MSPEVGADIPSINCDVRWTEWWAQQARVGILRSVTSPLPNDTARYIAHGVRQPFIVVARTIGLVTMKGRRQLIAT